MPGHLGSPAAARSPLRIGPGPPGAGADRAAQAGAQVADALRQPAEQGENQPERFPAEQPRRGRRQGEYGSFGGGQHPGMTGARRRDALRARHRDQEDQRRGDHDDQQCAAPGEPGRQHASGQEAEANQDTQVQQSSHGRSGEEEREHAQHRAAAGHPGRWLVVLGPVRDLLGRLRHHCSLPIWCRTCTGTSVLTGGAHRTRAGQQLRRRRGGAVLAGSRPPDEFRAALADQLGG